MFTASDIGWVVGHSYTVYAPLLHGMTTVVYEGLPVRPDPGIWWKIVEDHGVTVMFTAPTAIRALQKQDQKYIEEHDISSLRYLFLAGEPLDVPTTGRDLTRCERALFGVLLDPAHFSTTTAQRAAAGISVRSYGSIMKKQDFQMLINHSYRTALREHIGDVLSAAGATAATPGRDETICRIAWSIPKATVRPVLGLMV